MAAAIVLMAFFSAGLLAVAAALFVFLLTHGLFLLTFCVQGGVPS